MHHTPTHQPVAEPFRNSLCRDIGHNWKPTPVSNYRLCQRSKCKAAQRLHQGRWMDVTTRPATHRSGSLLCHTEQAVMTWAATEPNQQGA
jgi:hypothetical protein